MSDQKHFLLRQGPPWFVYLLLTLMLLAQTYLTSSSQRHFRQLEDKFRSCMADAESLVRSGDSLKQSFDELQKIDEELMEHQIHGYR